MKVKDFATAPAHTVLKEIREANPRLYLDLLELSLKRAVVSAPDVKLATEQLVQATKGE